MALVDLGEPTFLSLPSLLPRMCLSITFSAALFLPPEYPLLRLLLFLETRTSTRLHSGWKMGSTIRYR